MSPHEEAVYRERDEARERATILLERLRAAATAFEKIRDTAEIVWQTQSTSREIGFIQDTAIEALDIIFPPVVGNSVQQTKHNT